MLNILVVCGAGLGSSFVCQMSVESVLKDLNVPAKLDHGDISSIGGSKADIIIAAKNFEPQVKRYNTNASVILLNKLIDKNEIKEKIIPVLKEKGLL